MAFGSLQSFELYYQWIKTVSYHWGKQLLHTDACFVSWHVNLAISILSQLNSQKFCLNLAMLPFNPLGWSAEFKDLLFLSSCPSSQARIPAFWSSSGLQWLIGCDSGKFTAALLPRTLLWWNKVHDVEFLCLDIYIFIQRWAEVMHGHGKT